MINLVSVRCSFENCHVQASYGLVKGEPLCCAKHKTNGMSNVFTKRCAVNECNIIPSYGTKRYTPTHCFTHKSVGMIKTNSRLCASTGCDTLPLYGYEAKKPTHCSKHKLSDMRNVYSKRCISEGCDTICMSDKYKGYCFRCFIYLFPEKTDEFLYKTKEYHVVYYVKTHINLTDYEIIENKSVGGCSKRRPDMAIDCWTHIIIIECDENQHNTTSYCSCDNKRTMQIFEDFGSRPIVFLRFNPDSYVNKHNVLIDGCFRYTKHYSLPVVRDVDIWMERMSVLHTRIGYHLSNIPCQEVNVEYLYYDGFE